MRSTLTPTPHGRTDRIDRDAVTPGAAPLRICVLGSLQTIVRGAEVALPQVKLRQLLCSLALNDNRTVSNHALIRDLWGDEPPLTALRALRVYVSQLRKFFGLHRVSEEYCRLTTQPSGYRLVLAGDIVDWECFARWREEARAASSMGQLDLARTYYRDALALRRGPALADMRLNPSLEASALWLDEEWLSALLHYVDLELRFGRQLEVLGELTRLAVEHPLHEGLHSRLMIALYQSGRAGDALNVYRRFRSRSVEDLGSEPGRRIQRVHRAVLASDDSILEVPDAWTL